MKKYEPQFDYALLGSNKNNLAAGKAITDILEKAATEIQKVAQNYPDVGIGDTAMGEEIVSALYTLIH